MSSLTNQELVLRPQVQRPYRGRLAPSPTGYLHAGHARTFWTACQRAADAGGDIILRIEDIDIGRSRPEFARALLEDLRWIGCHWSEGPDCPGLYGSYVQSERTGLYRDTLKRLIRSQQVYPCHCSRRDIERVLSAPHAGDEEPIYPGTCRPATNSISAQPHGITSRPCHLEETAEIDIREPRSTQTGRAPHWRFRVPDGRVITFEDQCQGEISFTAGRDFGDFLVWRHDGIPSYQLAVVVDDALMKITEVVRGADLLVSTARQLLLYEALGWTAPRFYHAPLIRDGHGTRLAKRHASATLRDLRAAGTTLEQLRAAWQEDIWRLQT